MSEIDTPPRPNLNASRSSIYDWFTSWVTAPPRPEHYLGPSTTSEMQFLHYLTEDAATAAPATALIQAARSFPPSKWSNAFDCFRSTPLKLADYGIEAIEPSFQKWQLQNASHSVPLLHLADLEHLLAAMNSHCLIEPLATQHRLLHNNLLPLTRHAYQALPTCAGPYREFSHLLYRWCRTEDLWLSNHAY